MKSFYAKKSKPFENVAFSIEIARLGTHENRKLLPGDSLYAHRGLHSQNPDGQYEELDNIRGS